MALPHGPCRAPVHAAVRAQSCLEASVSPPAPLRPFAARRPAAPTNSFLSGPPSANMTSDQPIDGLVLGAGAVANALPRTGARTGRTLVLPVPRTIHRPQKKGETPGPHHPARRSAALVLSGPRGTATALGVLVIPGCCAPLVVPFGWPWPGSRWCPRASRHPSTPARAGGGLLTVRPCSWRAHAGWNYRGHVRQSVTWAPAQSPTGCAPIGWAGHAFLPRWA